MSDLIEHLQRLDAEADYLPVPVQPVSASVDVSRAGLLAYLRAPWVRPAHVADLEALRKGLLRAYQHDALAYRCWSIGSILTVLLTMVVGTTLFDSVIGSALVAMGLTGAGLYLAHVRTPFFGNPTLNRRWAHLKTVALTDDLVALAQQDPLWAKRLQAWTTDGVGLLAGDLVGLEDRLKVVRADAERQAQQNRQQALAHAAWEVTTGDSFH